MSSIVLKSAPKELFAGLGVDTKTTTTIQIPLSFLEAIKTATRKSKKGGEERRIVSMAMPLERLMDCLREADPEDVPSIPAKFTIAKPVKAASEKKPRVPKAPKEGVVEEPVDVLTEDQLETLLAKGVKAGAHLKSLAKEFTEMDIPEEDHKAARKHWARWREAQPDPVVEDVLSLDQMEELKAKGYSSSVKSTRMAKDLTEMGIPEESHKKARDEYVAWARENGVPSSKEVAKEKSPKASPKASPKSTPATAPVEVKEEPIALEEEEEEEITAVPLPAPMPEPAPVVAVVSTETPKKAVKKAIAKTPGAPKKAPASKKVVAPVVDAMDDLADLIEE